MQTKRKFAHELYPHAEEGQTRPLAVEVPYLYAMATGLNVWGTDWFDLTGGTDDQRRLAHRRIDSMVAARHKALIADALLQGLSGDEAWSWADSRAWDESGEWVAERAEHYGIDYSAIKPYPILSEPDEHQHLVLDDRLGHITKRVSGKESECAECCEPLDGAK